MKEAQLPQKEEENNSNEENVKTKKKDTKKKLAIDAQVEKSESEDDQTLIQRPNRIRNMPQFSTHRSQHQMLALLPEMLQLQLPLSQFQIYNHHLH